MEGEAKERDKKGKGKLITDQADKMQQESLQAQKMERGDRKQDWESGRELHWELVGVCPVRTTVISWRVLAEVPR